MTARYPSIPQPTPNSPDSLLACAHALKKAVELLEADVVAALALARSATTATGAVGTQGVPGFTGPDGEQGDPGVPGVPGLPGATGAQGFVGQYGRDGDDGDHGPPGLSGGDGAPGAQGAPGRPGDDGDDGLSIPGIAGAAGATGAAGADGMNLSTVNRQTGSYTLVIGDANGLIEMNVAGANNLTVPPNASVAFAAKTVIRIVQYGAGQTTVVAGAGVTLLSSGSKLKITGQYLGATIYQTNTANEWVVQGDLSA